MALGKVHYCIIGVWICIMLKLTVPNLDKNRPIFVRRISAVAEGGGRKPIMLMWSRMNEMWWKDESAVVEVNCGKHQCLVTKNRDYFNQSDVIMFLNEASNERDLPTRRQTWQPWLLTTGESPENVQIPKYFDGKINISCTYHRQSALPCVYGYFTAYEEKDKPSRYPDFKTVENIYMPPVVKDEQNIRKITSNKEKDVLWFVSNCGPKSRKNFAEELKNLGFKVDVFGHCGARDPCHRNEKCLGELAAKYYFYLAFENTYCEDYISEKLWKSLERGMVPIVSGAPMESYKLQLPPDSFIHVDSFNSTAELAKYMKYLMENKDAYMKYHKWRDIYLAVNEPTKLCTICSQISTFKTNRPAHADLSSWWDISKMCKK